MRYRALPILLVVVWGTAAPLQAQPRLAGQAIDNSGRPVAYVNAQLLAAADSSFIRGAITDESGHFVLEAIRTGEYLLYVSLIGYDGLILIGVI